MTMICGYKAMEKSELTSGYTGDEAFQFSATGFDYDLRFDSYWQVGAGYGVSTATGLCNYQC